MKTKRKEQINYTPEERQLINNIIKANNRTKGSKYIKQTESLIGRSYNISYKQPVKGLELIKQADLEQAAKQVLVNQ